MFGAKTAGRIRSGPDDILFDPGRSDAEQRHHHPIGRREPVRGNAGALDKFDDRAS
jgi:hypothetical protein